MMGSKELSRSFSIVTLIIFLCFSLTCLPVSSRKHAFFDFSQYWNATRHYIAGLDPYRPFDLPLAPDSGIEDRTKTDQHYPVFSLPLTFLVFSPFAFFSQDHARFLYAVLFCLSLSVSLYLLQLIYWKDCHLLSRPLNRLVFSFLCFPWGPVILLLSWGGVSWISLLGLTVCLYLWSRNFLFLAGMALSITLIKPHLLWLIYLYIMLRGIFRGEARLFLGFAVSAVCALILSAVLHPGSYLSYIASIGSPSLLKNIVNASIPSISRLLMPSSVLLIPLVFLIAASSVLLLNFFKGRLNNPVIAVPVLLPFSLLFSPYAWGHDYILCAPLLCYSCMVALHSDNKKILCLLLSAYAAIGIFLSLKYSYNMGCVFILPQLLLAVMAFYVTQASRRFSA